MRTVGESAEAIDREVEYLNRLVTNLLDLTRIEAGVLRADRAVFELDDLIETTIVRLRPRFGDRPFEVAVGADVVEVDPVFVDGALSNLLENELKYVPPGRLVRVRRGAPARRAVRAAHRGGRRHGVPDAVLARVFEKFYRAPRITWRAAPGTGVGLSVVRGLVDAFGGRVSARRSELGGLAVDLDLPAAAAAPPRRGAGSVSARRSGARS